MLKEKKEAEERAKVKAFEKKVEEEGEEEEEEEEEEHIMAIDEYYPDDHKEKEIEDSSIPRRYT